MLIERNCRCISGNRLPCGRGTFRLGPWLCESAFTDSAFVCTTCSSTSRTDHVCLGLCASQNVMQFQPPNKIPPLQRAQLCEGGTWYHWQPAAVRRKELRLGPWLCETGFRRWCFCLYRYPSAGVMHRFRWSLSAGKAACGKHTESFCTAGQNAANQHFQYTIIIRKRQVNNVN